MASNHPGPGGPRPNRAVFLDKDDTLIVNVPYNVDPDRIVLAPGAEVGLKRLADAGYRLVVVSNQSGVARGYFAESALAGVEARLGELLGAFGVKLDGFYYCPHHPEGIVEGFAHACDCRKPAPGMLIRAAIDLDLNLEDCWLVGDFATDVEAGKAAGCRTILINLHEKPFKPFQSPEQTPDATARSLEAVADIILDADDKGQFKSLPLRSSRWKHP